jgi:hypothetical protein
MPLLVKRLIVCLSVHIVGCEECYADLFVCCVYRALKIVGYMDGQNDRKMYTIKIEGEILFKYEKMESSL